MGELTGQSYLRVPKIVVGWFVGALWGAALATWVVLSAVGLTHAAACVAFGWLVPTALGLAWLGFRWMTNG